MKRPAEIEKLEETLLAQFDLLYFRQKTEIAIVESVEGQRFDRLAT